MNDRGAARRDSVNQALMKAAKEDKTMKSKDNEKINKTPKTGSASTKLIVSPNSKTETDTDKFDNFKGDILKFFQEYDEKLEKKLESFDKKFSRVFDDLKSELQGMRADVGTVKSEIKDLRNKVNEMEESLNFQTQMVEEKEDSTSNFLRKHMEDLQSLNDKMLRQEIHDRKYNLLLYGFPEKANENLKTIMIDFFKSKLEIPEEDVSKMTFANYHRIPSRGSGPKPIIVKFVCMADRDMVFSKSLHPVLRQEKKRILSDLPITMKQERGKLAKLAYDIRQKENKQTRIVEKGTSLFLEVRDEKGKPWERRDAYADTKDETENVN